MFRHVFHAQIKKGEFRQFVVAFEQWERIRRDKAYAPTKLFSPFVGRINSIMLVTDHESMAAFRAEGDRLGGDPDVMAARRAMTDFVDPAAGAHDELWEEE